ncbi:hypothetical protein HK100_001895 [Physocladia obscura]|uniref:Uncharacterized protein n=1 Tax=Physocladia obscura TaxID=109957 RepID=A0AAD5SZ88_9FUNG|nr:hypothetical protein HK100_001895 [Physocladia obscura]
METAYVGYLYLRTDAILALLKPGAVKAARGWMCLLPLTLFIPPVTTVLQLMSCDNYNLQAVVATVKWWAIPAAGLGLAATDAAFITLFAWQLRRAQTDATAMDPHLAIVSRHGICSACMALSSFGMYIVFALTGFERCYISVLLLFYFIVIVLVAMKVSLHRNEMHRRQIMSLHRLKKKTHTSQ